MKYKYITQILFTLLSTSILSHPARSGELIQWQSNNIQYLRGHDYELGERQSSIVTLEHMDVWKYGDNFAFIDLIYPDGQDSSYYMELSPRFSFGKITGKDLSFGPIKDILISTTLEKGRGLGPQYLYGLAVDLDIPGFRFVSINQYVHDSTDLDGQTWQTTLVWDQPFEVAGQKFLHEGFADFKGHESTSHPNQLIVPRLLWDAGYSAGFEENQFYIGVEYQYWHNKYGVNGKTESVPQFQIKWVF